MSINDIVALIGQLGFPIVACVLLFILYFKSFEALKIAVDNNTKVLNRLVDKMGVDENEIRG